MIKKFDKLLVVCFLLIISIPLFGVFRATDPVKFENNFNRQLSKFPSYNKDFDKIFFNQLETWFSDHALLIPYLGAYWSKITFTFNVSAKSSQVVVGRGNWLFLGNDYAKSIDQFTGKSKPDLKQVNALVDNFSIMNHIAMKDHVPIIFTIAPDKQNIYPEYMPSNLIKSNSSNYLDILTREMKINKLPFVSLMEPELRSKQTFSSYGPLYLKGDSHWNYLGAYVAFQEIVNSSYYKNLDWLKLSSNISFDNRLVNDTDLTKILQLNNIYSYSPLPNFQYPKFSLTQEYGNTIESMSQFAFISNAKASVSPVIINNTMIKDNHTCLLLSDSFANYLSIYFYNVCSKTIRLHPEAGEKYNLNDLIKTYHPDFILFELAERSLITYKGGFVQNNNIVVAK